MKDPKDAVIRLCQECTNPMKLQNYEFDIEYRWYEFYCKNCGYNVHLGESIEQYIREWHQKSGELLEPLTKEELKKQAFEKTSEGQKDTKKILDEIVEDIDPEKRRKKLRDMHDISDMDKGDWV